MMSDDTKTPPADPRVAEIDAILTTDPDRSGSAYTAELTARGLACLERLAPPDSSYRMPFQPGPKPRKGDDWLYIRGRLIALRDDIRSGRFDATTPATKWVPFREDTDDDAPRAPAAGAPPWTALLARYIVQSDPDPSMDYPEPDWHAWIDRGIWQTWVTVPPLLLKHDPVSAMNAPYFNAAWCAANLDRLEARVMKTVLLAACEGELGYREDGDPSPGFRVKPLDAVVWALGLVSVDTPDELVAAARLKRRRRAAVEALLNDDAPSAAVSSSEDASVSLPPITARNPSIRQAFVMLTAMRCAGLKGGDLPGASQRLLGARDETVERYIRDGKLTRMYNELMGWAAHRDDRWPRIWAAFRSEWNMPAEIKGAAQDRTEKPDPG